MNVDGSRQRLGSRGAWILCAVAVVIASVVVVAGGRLSGRPEAIRVTGATSGSTRAPDAVAPLPATGALLAMVSLEGAPVVGARMVLAGDAARLEGRTDTTGSLHLEGIAPGQYRLEALELGDDTPICNPAGACITRLPSLGEARRVTVVAGATTNEVFSF